MSDKNVYLELRNKCDMFKYYVKTLSYYNPPEFRSNVNYYLNLRVLINQFLIELKSNIKKYEKYRDIIDKLIKQVETYIDRNPEQALKNIEEFCYKFKII